MIYWNKNFKINAPLDFVFNFLLIPENLFESNTSIVKTKLISNDSTDSKIIKENENYQIVGSRKNFELLMEINILKMETPSIIKYELKVTGIKSAKGFYSFLVRDEESKNDFIESLKKGKWVCTTNTTKINDVETNLNFKFELVKEMNFFDKISNSIWSKIDFFIQKKEFIILKEKIENGYQKSLK